MIFDLYYNLVRRYSLYECRKCNHLFKWEDRGDEGILYSGTREITACPECGYTSFKLDKWARKIRRGKH